MDDRDPLLCTRCGHVGVPVQATPGSFVIEVVLWLCFIVPGLIYSIWRLSARGPACAQCDAASLVPTTSPVARTMAAEHGIALPAARPPSPAAYAAGGGLGRLVGRALRQLRGR